jgi:D-glycero-D-manno-heptose 1,7-bisphosphate phosphatase
MGQNAALKLIVLDRDGVINEDSDEYVKTAEEWLPIPGSLEAIAKLHQAGWRVVLFTNQSGIGRGLFGLDDLQAMHVKMHGLVNKAGGRIDAVLFCPHVPSEECECRKPRPGMLYELMERLGVEMDNVPVVGDSLRDLQAAMAVGARPMLVRTGKGERTLTDNKFLNAEVFDDLADCVDKLLAEHEEKPS